mmetsp:Transcript_16616/g.35938  ORF Transcript_16616/g.35938 Transcript_16616/m.35938 type:complete len:250 (-) Transcript_16616:293-1042(-)
MHLLLYCCQQVAVQLLEGLDCGLYLSCTAGGGPAPEACQGLLLLHKQHWKREDVPLCDGFLPPKLPHDTRALRHGADVPLRQRVVKAGDHTRLQPAAVLLQPGVSVLECALAPCRLVLGVLPQGQPPALLGAHGLNVQGKQLAHKNRRLCQAALLREHRGQLGPELGASLIHGAEDAQVRDQLHELGGTAAQVVRSLQPVSNACADLADGAHAGLKVPPRLTHLIRGVLNRPDLILVLELLVVDCLLQL